MEFVWKKRQKIAQWLLPKAIVSDANLLTFKIKKLENVWKFQLIFKLLTVVTTKIRKNVKFAKKDFTLMKGYVCQLRSVFLDV